jgi:hypothetical protein
MTNPNLIQGPHGSASVQIQYVVLAAEGNPDRCRSKNQKLSFNFPENRFREADPEKPAAFVNL